MNKEEAIAKVRKQAAIDIAKVEAECWVRERLPRQPWLVHVHELYGRAGSVKYQAKTWAEILEIVNLFKPEPSYKHTNSGISMRHYPPEGQTPDPVELVLDIRSLPVVEFFINIEGQVWEANIEFPLNLIGHYYKDKPNARTNFKYIFESKKPLASIANFRAPEYHGEGSKRDSLCRLTVAQLTEWSKENGN